MFISIIVEPSLEMVNTKYRRGFVRDVTCSQYFFSMNAILYQEISCSGNSSVVNITCYILKLYFYNQLNTCSGFKLLEYYSMLWLRFFLDALSFLPIISTYCAVKQGTEKNLSEDKIESLLQIILRAQLTYFNIPYYFVYVSFSLNVPVKAFPGTTKHMKTSMILYCIMHLCKQLSR